MRIGGTDNFTGENIRESRFQTKTNNQTFRNKQKEAAQIIGTAPVISARIFVADYSLIDQSFHFSPVQNSF